MGLLLKQKFNCIPIPNPFSQHPSTPLPKVHQTWKPCLTYVLKSSCFLSWSMYHSCLTQTGTPVYMRTPGNRCPVCVPRSVVPLLYLTNLDDWRASNTDLPTPSLCFFYFHKLSLIFLETILLSEYYASSVFFQNNYNSPNSYKLGQVAAADWGIHCSLIII